MGELKVSCQVSCQKCGWTNGVTLLTDEVSVLEAVLAFIRTCSRQHSSRELSGELLVIWKPLEVESK
jgi:hypothetical protein